MFFPVCRREIRSLREAVWTCVEELGYMGASRKKPRQCRSETIPIAKQCRVWEPKTKPRLLDAVMTFGGIDGLQCRDPNRDAWGPPFLVDIVKAQHLWSGGRERAGARRRIRWLRRLRRPPNLPNPPSRVPRPLNRWEFLKGNKMMNA